MMKSRVSRYASVLGNPIQNANHAWSHRNGLIFMVQHDGVRGFGEASPLPGYSPDTIEDCEQCLSGIELFDGDELSLSRIETFISAMPAVPAARFAVETALLDLLAQREDRGIAGLFDQSANQALRCTLLDSNSPVASAEACIARGVQCAKLKVGRDWTSELVAIRTLRSRFSDLQLRLDANTAWTVPIAKKNIADLEDLDIQFVEQPVEPEFMHKLTSSPVPLAADESLHTQAGRDALRPMLGTPALGALVLKPTVLGGFFACLQLQKLGKQNSTESIASHCFEGPVGTAAVAELAIVLDSSLAAGVDEHSALAAMSTKTVPQFHGRGIVPHNHGLGVEIDL